jgi:hypothetical protein
MKARGALLILALVLAAMLGWLFHTQFTWTREDAWAGFQGEAQDNDFLAAQRLLQRTGHLAVCLQDLPATLPAPGDVLILPRRTLAMAPADAARLAGWVSGGGLLLAEGAEPEAPAGPVRDALFARFGARLVPADTAPGVGTHTLGDAALQLDLRGRARIMGPGADSALVRCPLGKGEALLCTDLGCLSNRRIQAFDHADFLCAVAALRPGGTVRIVTIERAATAWAWLWRHAGPALVALAALCLGALWAAAPRFGPVEPAPDPARRSFLEHLDACGRYQWRAAQGRPLLDACRGAFLRRLGQLHPGWADLEPAQLCPRLAQRSGLDRELIERALYHPGPHAAGFLEAVQTLQLLGKHL